MMAKGNLNCWKCLNRCVFSFSFYSPPYNFKTSKTVKRAFWGDSTATLNLYSNFGVDLQSQREEEIYTVSNTDPAVTGAASSVA